jgi:hypothetical protein
MVTCGMKKSYIGKTKGMFVIRIGKSLLWKYICPPFWIFVEPIVFPSRSHMFPKFPMCSPNMFLQFLMCSLTCSQ